MCIPSISSQDQVLIVLGGYICVHSMLDSMNSYNNRTRVDLLTSWSLHCNTRFNINMLILQLDSSPHINKIYSL